VLARRANGEVWASGDNRYGQLGDGTIVTHAKIVPCYASDGNPIVSAAAIVAGRDHSVVLLNNGLVLSSGANHFGQLGVGHYFDSLVFTPAVWADKSLVEHIVGLEARDDYTMLLRADDTRWLAGRYPKLSIKPDGKVVTYKSFVEF
jgi:alpha-tubulin suppressor-like RCC1 family protein